MMSEAPRLPARDPRGHKGTFGAVAVVGGCAHEPDERGLDGLRMLGGPCFSAVAALRSGCGLARLAVPRTLVDHALAVAPGATGLAMAVDEAGRLVGHLGAAVIDGLVKQSNALIVGPGMGTSEGAEAVVIRAAGQDQTPLVLDADGLNNLAGIAEFWRDFRAAAVLTPHPGEFARLAKALSIGADAKNERERAAGADELARKLGCVVVLKGASTIVTDGHRAWTHDHPNPALGTAGTGDVLSGVIGGLIAQHHRKPVIAGERTVTSEKLGGLSLFDCARAGVAAHSEAARRWTERMKVSGGLLATDLLEEIPAAVEQLRHKT
ncbi:MAG TPA: NAD(P)H-hydrate dehydratase [Phycisphaerales bacterium]|nr:NAD(P)H-hydrate dehydratase [Phycisphaerales bacterium]